MATVDISTFDAMRKRNEITSLYVFYGPDDYRKRNRIQGLIKQVIDDAFFDYNYTFLDQDHFSADELLDMAMTVPMFSAYRCIHISDLDFAQLDQQGQDKILALLDNLPKELVLIFQFQTVEFSSNLKTSDAMHLFYETASRVGTLVQCGAPSDNDLVRFVQTKAQKLGKRISAKNASVLVDECDRDVFRIQNEIDKLSFYVKDEITYDDLQEMVAFSPESKGYLLTSAIRSKRFEEAYRLLDDFFLIKMPEQMIFAIISNYYVDLYRAKLFKQDHFGLEQAKSMFESYSTGKRLSIAYDQEMKYSLESLKKCLDLLAKADDDLKTSLVDPRIIFDRLIIELGTVS